MLRRLSRTISRKCSSLEATISTLDTETSWYTNSRSVLEPRALHWERGGERRDGDGRHSHERGEPQELIVGDAHADGVGDADAAAGVAVERREATVGEVGNLDAGAAALKLGLVDHGGHMALHVLEDVAAIG